MCIHIYARITHCTSFANARAFHIYRYDVRLYFRIALSTSRSRRAAYIGGDGRAYVSVLQTASTYIATPCCKERERLSTRMAQGERAR